MSAIEGVNDLPFGAEFPPATYAHWLSLVEGVLKGEGFDERLVWHSYDDIAIRPLYTRERDGGVAARIGAWPGTRNADAPPWHIAQSVSLAGPHEANNAILDDLNGGATAVMLKIAETPDAPGMGVWTVDDLDAALDGVHLDMIPVHLDAGRRGAQIAALLVELYDARNTPPPGRRGSFGLDPLGVLARTGSVAGTAQSWGDLLAQIARAGPVAGSALQTIAADGRPFHEAGAPEALELACTLAGAVAYLRMLENAGIGPEEAAGQIRFILAADADLFLTLAKFRALRALWADVGGSCGFDAAALNLSAHTSLRMMSVRDPWVNMLRATVSCLGATMGGADTLSVAPYTAALGASDEFVRRIARNVQIISREEAFMGRVRDPAGGSWYVESLTQALAQKAWAHFQDIEAAGGLAGALCSGRIRDLIAVTAERRAADIATRKATIVGVSDFADLGEKPVTPGDEKSKTAARAKKTVSAGTFEALRALARDGKAPALSLDGTLTGPALRPVRFSEAFERLRDAAAKSDRAPRVFIANLGTPAQFGARARFARNLFAAGGIEAAAGEGFDSIEACLAAFAKNPSAYVVICSSDEVYARSAVELAKALKDAGARAICLAGRPGALKDALSAAGVNATIHAGCDALAVLRRAHDVLGLAP